MKISLYVAISLDGFIARADGAIDWLGDPSGALTDADYLTFYADVDALVMGGKTYRQVLEMGDWPYAGKDTWVYTRSPLISAPPGVAATAETPEALVERLRHAGKRHCWVLGGGEINSLFLRAGLIDEMRVFVMPIALGAGVPLFTPPVVDYFWELAELKRWRKDVAELRYIRRP